MDLYIYKIIAEAKRMEYSWNYHNSTPKYCISEKRLLFNHHTQCEIFFFQKIFFVNKLKNIYIFKPPAYMLSDSSDKDFTEICCLNYYKD